MASDSDSWAISLFDKQTPGVGTFKILDANVDENVTSKYYNFAIS